MHNHKLRATVFEVQGENAAQTNKDLWEAVIGRIIGKHRDIYARIPGKQFVAAVQKSASAPDKYSDLIHFRTVQANIIRADRSLVLMELSAGNLFCRRTKNGQPSAAVDQQTLNGVYGRHSVWVRKKSEISLGEHIDVVALFIGAAKSVGIELKEAVAEVVHEESRDVYLRSGSGLQAYRTGIYKNLLKHPLRTPEPWTLSVVFPENHFNADLGALEHSFRHLFAGRSGLKQISTLDRQSVMKCDELVSLILLSNDELLKGGPAEHLLRAMGSSGRRFNGCSLF
jgi:hypothetical protein